MLNKYINKYLPIFPIETKSKKCKKGYLKVPATNVIGSPMNGTQPNKSDHFPYFVKNNVALFIFFSFIGNHFFFVKYLE